jgi:TNF receptor-associated factor 3
MCARAYLNGDGLGKKTHVSLFFVVMRGDYDALLSWPFRERVEMTLLDALGGGKHYSDRFNPDARNESFKKPSQAMNKASGFPLFLAQSVVESSGEPYLAHDTIYIKVVVGRREIH